MLATLCGIDGYCSAQMLEMYKEFCTKYPVVSIEDPFEQDDWEPAKALTAENVCQVTIWQRMHPSQQLLSQQALRILLKSSEAPAKRWIIKSSAFLCKRALACPRSQEASQVANA